MPAEITYLGNCRFEEDSDPVWSGSGYELETCRVAWRGAAPLKAAFLASLRKFHSLPGFPKMFYIDYSDDGAKVFPTVELIYTGFRTGSEPEPKAEDTKAVQTAQTQLTPDAGTYSGQTISLQVTYLASRTNWTWYQGTDPKTGKLPAFVRCRIPVSPLNNILLWRVTLSTGEVGTIGLAESIKLLNTLTVSEQIADLGSDAIVPGALWRCQASVDYSIRG